MRKSGGLLHAKVVASKSLMLRPDMGLPHVVTDVSPLLHFGKSEMLRNVEVSEGYPILGCFIIRIVLFRVLY